MFKFIINILIGALVGFLSGEIMKSKGSFLRNVILGLLAGALGGWLGGSHGFIVSLCIDVAAGCLLIWLAKKIFK